MSNQLTQIGVIILLTISGIINPFSTDVERTGAEAVFLHGDYKSALQQYSNLLKIYPNDSVINYNAGLLYLLIGDTLSAELNFISVCEKDPEDAWSHYRLAELTLSRGDTVSALSFLNNALERDRDHTPTLIYLAQVLSLRGETETAISFAKKALTKNEMHSPARLTLAQCYYRAGQLIKALAEIEKGINIFPQDDLLESGSRIALALGDTSRASLYLELYEKLFPSRAIFRKSNQTGDASFNPDFRTDSEKVDSLYPWLSRNVRYVYKATWGPFTLGQLIVEIGDTTRINGEICIVIVYRIISNPFIPIIRINNKYTSYLTSDLKQTLFFEAMIRDHRGIWEYTCEMDRETGKLIQRTVGENNRIEVFPQNIPVDLVDGTSLLIRARTLVRDQQSGRIAVFINEGTGWTNINFNNRCETINICGDEIKAWKITGSSNYVGVAGLTGRFTGWFSTDGEAIPLKAKQKILIGSIKQTLERIEEF